MWQTLLNLFIKIKVISDRQRNYLSYINFLMIAYLFLDKTGWYWWYLLLLPLWIVWAWFDITRLYGKELDYIYQKSKVMKDIWANKK